ncbi:hypothetical protein [Legionella fairfieldensis]|uniref:hypothetical protein n=1 Tax=Legionella fairfieldensis TaxID=45064 RepID=UPI001F5ECF8C|nr:hypothetical protein [Legionella fairfieldensis]
MLCYKSRFVTVVLLLGYTFIHTQLTGIYTDTPLASMVDFSARLPYGQRLLVPMLVRVLTFLPLKIDQLFFLMEWLFISLFYFALFKLLQQEFKERAAQLLSWLFILLLPLMTVINYRFNYGGEATFFYPADSASLFFMATGFLFCLRSQWFYFIPWVFLATLNRESSFLLVLMIPALHWRKLSTVFKPIFFALLTYCFTRLLVLAFLHHVPGSFMEWYFRASTHTYFEANLQWLLNEQNIFLFIFCFAGLPLFWFAFYDYIPLQYRPLRYVVLFHFLVLLLVGNFMEARIFHEIVLILYLPVSIALSRWLTGLQPICSYTGFIYYINRYAVLALLILITIFRQFLDKGVIWLAHYF